jgi:DNA-binding response OmpR family regulator
VVLIRWPEERDEAATLIDAGVAILYLVASDAPAPEPQSCLEDWVRLPGDERDVGMRVQALERRAAAHRHPPAIDDQGRLRYRGKVLTLTQHELPLVRTLVERFGEVVADAELEAEVDGHTDPAHAVVRLHMTQLRSRLRNLDLLLRRIRRRGYALSAR